MQPVTFLIFQGYEIFMLFSVFAAFFHRPAILYSSLPALTIASHIRCRRGMSMGYSAFVSWRSRSTGRWLSITQASRRWGAFRSRPRESGWKRTKKVGQRVPCASCKAVDKLRARVYTGRSYARVILSALFALRGHHCGLKHGDNTGLDRFRNLWPHGKQLRQQGTKSTIQLIRVLSLFC